MIDIFEETKARLTMQDVALRYGFTPNRAGFIKCPFHTGDRTASLKIYPGGRGWHCFGCNRSGSVVDFVAELYVLDPLSAVRRLNDDFHLNLPLDRQQTPRERTDAQKAAQRRRELSETAQLFETWRGTMLDKLTAVFRMAHLTIKDKRMDEWSVTEALAVQEQAHIEYLSDLLLSGSMEDMVQIFRERRRISQLCEKILQTTQTKSEVA